MKWQDWWTLIRAQRGLMPDPRATEAKAQQQRVTGGGSLRVDVAAEVRAAHQWRAAAACAERGLYGAAAHWAIAASGCDPVHTVEGE